MHCPRCEFILICESCGYTYDAGAYEYREQAVIEFDGDTCNVAMLNDIRYVIGLYTYDAGEYELGEQEQGGADGIFGVSLLSIADLVVVDKVENFFVGREKQWGDVTVFTAPMEEDFLVFR